MRELDAEMNELSRRVIAAAVAVHRALGPGFLESVYENAMCIEMTRMGIPFVPQKMVRVEYAGQPVGEQRLDALVDDRLIVDYKAIETVPPIQKQVIRSYLKATGLTLALILNFHAPVMRDGIERIILT